MPSLILEQSTIDKLKIFNYGISNELVKEIYEEELSAIEEATGNNTRLVIYPNPAGSSISITVLTEPNAKVGIKLTSITGSQVMASDNRADAHGRIEKKVNLSHLKPGIYLVYIQTRNETMAYKLIITK